MENNTSAYMPYEGLKLPNEVQRNLTNEQVNWRDWGEPITAPGFYYGPAAAERGMADEDRQYNDKFFYIQALYRKGLDRMLVEELGLFDYDREIGEQSDRFAQQDIEAYFKDGPRIFFWPTFSMMNLDYIYLRNSVHVERLEGGDLRLFEEAYEARSTEVSEEMREVVERTWKFFINVDREGGSDRVQYGRWGLSSDTLVLEIRIGHNYTDDEKDEEGLVLDELYEEYRSGTKKVRDEIAPRMEKEVAQKAGIPVKIWVNA